MVLLSLVLAVWTRLSGADITQMPPAKPVMTRYLQFVDRADGAVVVLDARRAAKPIQILPPGSNGFVRATMRSFARDRRSRDIGAAAPFRLSASADGRLTLEDPATGRSIELEAFGHTNAGVFAGFLAADEEPRHD
jgi:putative photosynthetic complex assembly protein